MPFSAKVAVAADEITGASFWFNTVIATDFVLESRPSEAVTTTSYTLLALASPGDSKFGGLLNVTRPVEPSILKNAASVPDRE